MNRIGFAIAIILLLGFVILAQTFIGVAGRLSQSSSNTVCLGNTANVAVTSCGTFNSTDTGIQNIFNMFMQVILVLMGIVVLFGLFGLLKK